MTRVELVNLRHVYETHPRRRAPLQPVVALKRLDEVFDSGIAHAIVGPDDAGKTTLMRLLSGLIAPSEGRIRFGVEDVTDRRAEQRNAAHVFETPCVYATMTVRENIAFPLRNHRLAPAEARRRVDEVLDMLGLTPKSGGSVKTLGPYEKQKVALGRALVRGPSACLVLDEPLGALDPGSRWRLLAEIRALQRRLGTTMIYATCDPTQALSFGQRVVVMADGEVLQAGAPSDLFDRPRHTFVGRFIGSPGMNVLPVNVEGASAHLGGQVISLTSAPDLKAVAKLELGVRPEHVRIGADGIGAQVMRVENTGRLRIVRARIQGMDVAAVVPEGHEIPAEPRLSFEPRNVHLYADSWRVELGAAP